MSAWALSGQVITPQTRIDRGLVEIDGPHITWVGPADQYQGNARVRHYGQCVIAPGFIDLHVHGGGGGSFREADASSMRRALAFHGRHGTTGVLATTSTAPLEAIAGALRVAQRLMAGDEAEPGAALLGVHVEGPWLNPEKAGGQPIEFMRAPRSEEFAALATLAPIRWATIAPELPGAEQLVRTIRAHGAVVSAGHTNATYAMMRTAVTWGLEHCTHLFNAMSALHHREPGVVGAGLALPELTVEVIADGIHVHPAALRAVYAAKGWERLLLVTDAVEPAGCADGVYAIGGRARTVADGAVRLPDGTLAGSTLTLNRAVALMVGQVGVPLMEAVAMASLVPARRLRLAHRTGSLAPGMDADVVVFDEHFEVQLTAVRGQVAFQQRD